MFLYCEVTLALLFYTHVLWKEIIAKPTHALKVTLHFLKGMVSTYVTWNSSARDQPPSLYFFTYYIFPLTSTEFHEYLFYAGVVTQYKTIYFVAQVVPALAIERFFS